MNGVLNKYKPFALVLGVAPGRCPGTGLIDRRGTGGTGPSTRAAPSCTACQLAL
jgi:hypothetical protein